MRSQEIFMDNKSIQLCVTDAICDVAPELTAEMINLAADIRDEYDIDSMDFLNVIASIKRSTGISIPELDYPKLDTVSHAVSYLEEKLN